MWEVGERIRSGAVKLGRNKATAQAKAEAGIDWRDPWPPGMDPADEHAAPASQPTSRPLTDWEQYTLDFIQRYRLDDEQSQKALAVLKECQQRRHAIEALYKQRQDRKNEHIEWIFREVLKPRLKKLPTRRQRAEAESSKREGVRP